VARVFGNPQIWCAAIKVDAVVVSRRCTAHSENAVAPAHGSRSSFRAFPS
jgi:hypothetical protein